MKKEGALKRWGFMFVVILLFSLLIAFCSKNIQAYAETDKIDISSQITVELRSVPTGYEEVEVDGVKKHLYKYTGNEIQPFVMVYWPSSWKNQYGINSFQQNRDWTITYSANTEIGYGTVTISGIGQFTGTVTETFQIVSILPKEQAEIERNRKEARIPRFVLFVILCGACIAYGVVKIIRIRSKRKVIAQLPAKNLEYLQNKDKTRTEKQKELFYKSARYLDWKRKSEGAVPVLVMQLKVINILAISIFASAAVALALAFFTNISYVFDAVCIGLVVACLILSIKAKKNDVSENTKLSVSSITSGADVCDKCAGDYLLFWEKAKYIDTEVKFETETLREGQKPYLGAYDEITDMQRVRKTRTKTRTVGSGSTARKEEYEEAYYEDVYTIKRTSYWYSVPAICQSCEEKVLLDRAGRKP